MSENPRSLRSRSSALARVACAAFLLPSLAPSILHAVVPAVLVQSTTTSGDTPTPTDNDYTRIDDAIQAAGANAVIQLEGTFDWTESNAAASWALGSDGTAATSDDYSIKRPSVSGLTITAASLGAAVIQGPGDLPSTDLEGVFVFDTSSGDSFPDLEISNLTILDFDLGIGLFGFALGSFDGALITNNFIRLPTDSKDDSFQNIAIHFARGLQLTISHNVIEIPGDGISDSGASTFAVSVGMQSNSAPANGFEGLSIDDNEIRILAAQSADPERVIGFWENGLAHSSNVSVTNNRFLNLAPGNDPAANRQNAFRVTSHSSASTTVTYAGNRAEGANLGLAQLERGTFSGLSPIQVTANTFLDNATAVLVRAGGSDVLRCNRFFGNDLAIGNTGTLADADAEQNWFGCNDGPANAACDPVEATVDADPWLVLSIAADATNLVSGATTGVTADVLGLSDGGTAECTLPDGALVTFGSSLGAMSPTDDPLASSQAESTFTAGQAEGTAALSASLDNETVEVPVEIAGLADLEITKDDGLETAAPGDDLLYTIVVFNHGPSADPAVSVTDLFPPSLTCSYTSVPDGGATGNTSSSGDLDDTLSMPSGSSVTYTASCSVGANALGVVSNTATAVGSFPDPTPDDRSATDETVVLSPAGVPALSPGALAVLALLLAGVALVLSNRAGR